MFSIRLMKEEDLRPLAAVYVRAFQDPQVMEKWTEETAYLLLADWFKRQPDLAVVAVDGGELVGAFVSGVRPWWDGYHLVDGELFVDIAHQGKGVGSELIRQVVVTAKEKYNAKLWETYTFRGTDFPMAWYKQLGFREIEEWTMIRADVDAVLEALSKS